MAKSLMGRPKKFKTVKELEALCEKYFQECIKDKKPFTITGLALALNTCRQSLLNYQEKPEFLDTIKRAKALVENYAAEKLFEPQPTGAIFALKNFGWSDKQSESKEDEDLQEDYKQPLKPDEPIPEKTIV